MSDIRPSALQWAVILCIAVVQVVSIQSDGLVGALGGLITILAVGIVVTMWWNDWRSDDGMDEKDEAAGV